MSSLSGVTLQDVPVVSCPQMRNLYLLIYLQALDGHKSSGDSGSRRDSSSHIFVGSSKEGLLSFRQFSTDKNKVGL